MAMTGVRHRMAQWITLATLWLFASPAIGQNVDQEALARPIVPGGETVVPPIPSDPRTEQVRGLLAGTLDVSVDPRTLFDVALEDETALRIEAARLHALLRAAEDIERPVESTRRTRGRRPTIESVDAGGLRDELATLDPTHWNQRLELDRTRLEFYELTKERRAELLGNHAARQQAARPQETDVERRTREANVARSRALEAARAARSETERVVAEALARVIDFEMRIREHRDEFQRRRDEIALRRDTVLRWQRRVRDAKAAGPPDTDTTYDALRRALHASRSLLSDALDALSENSSEIPNLGEDPLAAVPVDVPAAAARERRAAVERALVEARRDERTVNEEQASALIEEINTLNRERLALLHGLSSTKRDSITGFTSEGWDQARSEARHLSLLLAYHRHAARSWVETVRGSGSAGLSASRTLIVSLPLLLVVGAFAWGRRKTRALLSWGDSRLAAEDRAERRSAPSVARRVVHVLLKTHASVEWILFFLVLFWLLPPGAKALLEVQLLFSVIAWTLAGSLIVNVVNAVAAGSVGSTRSIEDSEVGELRLRSLRLVGRTVIAFTLILVLSSRLVGEGTIYSWVLSTCWFAAVPVVLLLVRWWRSTVFERLERQRKRGRLHVWLLANRSGWKSFAAATVGAIRLFTMGAYKLGQSWLSGFESARRIHAYLFKREIERLGEGQVDMESTPLAGEAFEALDPERPFKRWLQCPADVVRDALSDRARTRRGALVLVVAARGMGKSSLLQAIAESAPAATLLKCHPETRVAELDFAIYAKSSIVLIDDAHTLIEPRIGGLAKFDQSIAEARAHCDETTYVFSMDASVWPLLRRARDARPMFDEIYVLSPWEEGQLGALVAARCEDAGIVPHYDGLLDPLPAGADELDRLDALNATREGYERMLWDHVGGNPGLALEAWRVSLTRDQAGEVHVRRLQMPEVTALERLPDSSLFVLRAVLQFAPTTAERVAQATRLGVEEVLQDFRFGRARGFYEEHSGHVRISWPWLRAVSHLLERRQLLVNS